MSIKAILVAAGVLLLLGGVVLCQAHDPALAQSGGPGSSVRYAVEPGSVAGEGYRLTSLTWHLSGTASGGSYRLLCPAAPRLQGSGCCCTYLPLLVRSFP
jgi:hypothetical protein